MTATCPHCHQPVRLVKAGIRLPPIKATIFDAIAAAGDLGISTAELMHLPIYKGRGISPHTIKAHVNQINDLLLETDYKIRSLDHRVWVLCRVKRKVA